MHEPVLVVNSDIHRYVTPDNAHLHVYVRSHRPANKNTATDQEIVTAVHLITSSSSSGTFAGSLVASDILCD